MLFVLAERTAGLTERERVPVAFAASTDFLLVLADLGLVLERVAPGIKLARQKLNKTIKSREGETGLIIVSIGLSLHSCRRVFCM